MPASRSAGDPPSDDRARLTDLGASGGQKSCLGSAPLVKTRAMSSVPPCRASSKFESIIEEGFAPCRTGDGVTQESCHTMCAAGFSVRQSWLVVPSCLCSARVV